MMVEEMAMMEAMPMMMPSMVRALLSLWDQMPSKASLKFSNIAVYLPYQPPSVISTVAPSRTFLS